MGICDDCQQEMMDHVSCTKGRIKIKGKIYQRVRYWIDDVPEDHKCHDCGTPLNGIHHAGCDMERCPICDEQIIACGHTRLLPQNIIV